MGHLVAGDVILLSRLRFFDYTAGTRQAGGRLSRYETPVFSLRTTPFKPGSPILDLGIAIPRLNMTIPVIGITILDQRITIPYLNMLIPIIGIRILDNRITIP